MAQAYSYYAGEQPQRQRPLPPPGPSPQKPTPSNPHSTPYEPSESLHDNRTLHSCSEVPAAAPEDCADLFSPSDPQSGHSYASYGPVPSSFASIETQTGVSSSRPYPSYPPANYASMPSLAPFPGASHVAPSPPPGAQPPASAVPAIYSPNQSSLNGLSHPSPPRTDLEWRESSFISSYGGFSSPPEITGPSNGSYFGPPSSPPVASASAQPAYPVYPVYPISRSSNPPELPPLDLLDRPIRLSDDSAQHSLYSLPRDGSSTASRPTPPRELPTATHAHIAPPPRSSSSIGSFTRSPGREQSSAHQQSAAEHGGPTSQHIVDSPALANVSTGTIDSASHSRLPPPRPPRPPAPRQPTILMSPPLGKLAAPVHRNNSSESTLSRTVSSPSMPSFTASPSPDVSRRPSYATLSPNTSLHASSSFRRAESYEAPGFGSPALNADSAEAFGDGRSQYLNPALLSDLAVYVKDHVARGPRQKGAIEHLGFTGEDVVSAIRQALPAPASTDRRLALAIARSMQQALWFHEVDWSDAPLRDGPGGDVYAFLADEALEGRGVIPHGPNGGRHDDPAAELPTGVFVDLTRCYSPYCGQFSANGYQGACYSYSCPNRRNVSRRAHSGTRPSFADLSSARRRLGCRAWAARCRLFRASRSSRKPTTGRLRYRKECSTRCRRARSRIRIKFSSSSRASRSTSRTYSSSRRCGRLPLGGIWSCRHELTASFVAQGFVEPLRSANPPIIAAEHLESFLSSVLLNISDIREHSRAFLAQLRKKQQEGHVVHGIGQIVLAAAVEWGPAYLYFTTNFPMADFLFKEESSRNPRLEELLMVPQVSLGRTSKS